MTVMFSWFIRQLWFDADFGMEYIPSQGAAGNSGCLLTIWDNSKLELLDKRMGVNFISCLFKELIDLPLNGGSYTWSNKHEDLLLCRLDRCHACISFDANFSNATQTALYFIKPWSRITFGRVRRKEDELTEKIKSLNLAEENVALTQTQLEERTTLLTSLNNVKITRARMAFQRAKVKGFKDGDKNTQYFHKIANGKRQKNCITKMEVDGLDLFNQKIIKMEIHQYYSSLFTGNSDISPSFDYMNFRTVDTTQQCWVERPFEEDEVVNAIKICGANKDPGPDGYNLEFYKACWSILRRMSWLLLMNSTAKGSWIGDSICPS
ncbi:uncharacterized protein LOC113316559 [Papaver somniferum]|uniref:uncharacterized protein LOC113316559 n=1 Tax=Papaver somniferum TaxID=3469 RepID=UPI000E6F5EE2|nr:uncharacterized protein LOC113316559 [Papaver somniferum]